MSSFPVRDAFTTPEAIEDYFSDDQIVCLLCGRRMDRLAKHLNVAHQMTVDDYKSLYGLPWEKGLIGKRLRTRLRVLIREQPPRPLPVPGRRERIKPRQPFEDVLAVRSLSKVPKRPNAPADHERLLRMIRPGLTIRQITKSPDMPSLVSHYEYRKRNPEYDQRVRDLLDRMPLRGRRRSNGRPN